MEGVQRRGGAQIQICWDHPWLSETQRGPASRRLESWPGRQVGRQDISHVDPPKGIPPWRESQAKVGNEDDKDLLHNLQASIGRAGPHQVPGERSKSCYFEPKVRGLSGIQYPKIVSSERLGRRVEMPKSLLHPTMMT